jgi:2Fe-2S type ferredoxin
VVHSSDTLCKDVVNVAKKVESQGKVFKATFLASGEARTVDVPDDMYILDAAEKAGLDLPATCRGGICGACVARVVEGTVDASDITDLEFTVSQEEQADGMALICMTRATSDLKIETQCDWGYSLGVGEWKGATGRFSAAPEPLVGDIGKV